MKCGVGNIFAHKPLKEESGTERKIHFNGALLSRKLGIVLGHQTEVVVRFNEADPLGIVWHGHYLRYFEDGREAFGKEHGISYLDCYRHGIVVPIVSVRCDYSKPLRYGDTVCVHTTYVNTAAAKLLFEYKIFESKNNTLVASGASVQVFVDAKNFELQLAIPAFFEAWKKKQNLI